MPANRPTIRGNPGPHLTRNALVFRPETGLYVQELEYSGTQAGVAGLATNFRDNNREHRLDYEDGISRVTVYTPTQGAPVLDKYEVLWEMEQREIWNHPEVKTAAQAFDQIIPASEDSFRKRAENAVDGRLDTAAADDPVSGVTFRRVVAHLKAGITGWEQEQVLLRRTRVVPPSVASPCNIDAASLIYTTAQLDLPGDVLFILPDISSLTDPDPTNFQWGWRRRPSTSMIQGQANEQTSEFLLAAWSLMLYTPASSNADW